MGDSSMKLLMLSPVDFVSENVSGLLAGSVMGV